MRHATYEMNQCGDDTGDGEVGLMAEDFGINKHATAFWRARNF